MTPQEKQIAEQRSYGITVAQVAQCIRHRGNDHLAYTASIAKIATNRLAMLAGTGTFTHEQLNELEALRVLLNRITLAKKLEDQSGLVTAAE